MTAIGATTGQSVVKGLRRGCPDLQVVGIDTHPAPAIAGSAMVDRFHQVPPANDPDYIPELKRICETEQTAAIFPVVDAELSVLAAVADEVAGWGVRLWLPPRWAVEMANDKWRTHLFFREHGVDAPDAWLPEEIGGLHQSLPLVVKPRDGVSSRGVRVVRDADELLRAVQSVPNAMLQEWLDGPELTVDVTADWDGRILGVVPRLRVEVRSGLCYRGITVDEPELVEEATRIARLMELRGPTNIQCRKVDSRFRFFEINPRFSGSLPLSIEAGVNSPALLWRATLGEPVADAQPEWGVYMARHWQEVYRHGISPHEV